MIGSLPTNNTPNHFQVDTIFFLNFDAEYKDKVIAGTTVAADLAQLPKRSSDLWVNSTSAVLNTTG